MRSIFFSLAGVYDDLQPTELNVKSGDCFLPEQKSTVLIKETETPKGDEANVKKDDVWLVRNQGNFLPFSQKGRWHVYVNAIFIFSSLLQELSEFWSFWYLSFFAAGGFDYEPDWALHESHVEEKDEKYFAMKRNSSFEAEKGMNCLIIRTYTFFSMFHASK